jgi:hypothetical protein
MLTVVEGAIDPPHPADLIGNVVPLARRRTDERPQRVWAGRQRGMQESGIREEGRDPLSRIDRISRFHIPD